MRPTPAEVVRTLLAGRAPGTLHLPEATRPLPVAHAAEPDGTPLLLLADEHADALRPADGATDRATLLTILDQPPYPHTPSRGEAVLAGWVRPLTGYAERAAADRFAATNPVPELLDVGHTRTLYEMDLAEVRLERDAPEPRAGTAPGTDVLLRVELDDYQAAAPDPFAVVEVDLVTDLNDHHAEVHRALLGWTRRLVPTATAALPVRVDRYGMLVAVTDELGDRHLRLAFRTPLTGIDCLADVLRGLSCRCRAHHAGTA